MSNNTKTYIRILIDTLARKEKILRELSGETSKQAEILSGEELDIESFNRTIKAKDELLDKLQALDEGFLDLYAKVGEEMKANPGAYPEDIERAQKLVRTLTDLSAELSTAEERNRARLAMLLSKGKQKVKDFKISSAAASAYYKNMSGKHQDGDSYFFNRKK